MVWGLMAVKMNTGLDLGIYKTNDPQPLIQYFPSLCNADNHKFTILVTQSSVTYLHHKVVSVGWGPYLTEFETPYPCTKQTTHGHALMAVQPKDPYVPVSLSPISLKPTVNFF